jgi:hypothetical protein
MNLRFQLIHRVLTREFLFYSKTKVNLHYAQKNNKAKKRNKKKKIGKRRFKRPVTINIEKDG